MEFLVCIVWFIVGFAVSWTIHNRWKKPKPFGTLRVDHSDPDDKPYLFLEITEDPASLVNRKEVILDVKIKDYIPRV